jgi:hypothetical protein
MAKATDSIQNKLGLILGIAVIAMVAAGAWYTTNKPVSQQANTNQSLTVASGQVQDVADACNEIIQDSAVCSFLEKQMQVTKVVIKTVGNSEGSQLTSTITIDGDRSWLKAEGAINYEIINIGQDTYTKGGETWWKSAEKTTESLKISDFTYAAPSAEAIRAKQVNFTASGKEDCGELACYKYDVLDPAAGTAPTQLWFDTEDYLLRKSRVDTAANSSNEQVFNYENVMVPDPSPVKELTPNQYMIPGQAEPIEAPAGQ